MVGQNGIGEYGIRKLCENIKYLLRLESLNLCNQIEQKYYIYIYI